MPQIEVTFDIDANGIVHVSAKDKATNKEQSVTIQSSGGLSDDQIEKMVRDAEAYAEKDKERKQLIEARNDADTLLYSSEKNLQEHRAKLPADVVQAIEQGMTELRGAQGSDNLQEIKDKINTLQQALMKIGESLSSKSGAGDAAAGDAGAKKEEEAEFKDKK